MVTRAGFNASTGQGGIQSLTEYLYSHGLFDTYVNCPDFLKQRYNAVHAVMMPECRGVATSSNKRSYLPFDIEYNKWLCFDVEQNAPLSPFWHATLETHLPGICDNQWILEGREITSLNSAYAKNAAAAGVQPGDRGSGNELLVFMGTQSVAQQYLACEYWNTPLWVVCFTSCTDLLPKQLHFSAP